MNNKNFVSLKKLKKHFCKYISIILLLCLYFISLIPLSSLNKKTGQLAGVSTTFEINVNLTIGDHHFTLYGYTSPFALVTFSGLGIFDQTYADEQGYFVFKNRYSPFSPREACLTAQDQFGRLTSPVCLPPFPTNYNVEIGPVIMPPTLSLDKENYWVGNQVVLTGQTVPNSDVNLSLFTQNASYQKIDQLISFLPFVKNVYAFSFPKLEIKSDEKGNFSISLPSTSAKKYRLFTQTLYLEKNSPESRKLTVEILPRWMVIFKFLGFIIELIKTRLLELLILIELIAIAIYLIHSRLSHKQLSIIKYEDKMIMKINK